MSRLFNNSLCNIVVKQFVVAEGVIDIQSLVLTSRQRGIIMKEKELREERQTDAISSDLDRQ
jgi:hypothetical protein